MVALKYSDHKSQAQYFNIILLGLKIHHYVSLYLKILVLILTKQNIFGSFLKDIIEINTQV
jgi:hypothetical protein